MVLLILLGVLLGVLAGWTLRVLFVRFRAETEMPTTKAELNVVRETLTENPGRVSAGKP